MRNLYRFGHKMLRTSLSLLLWLVIILLIYHYSFYHGEIILGRYSTDRDRLNQLSTSRMTLNSLLRLHTHCSSLIARTWNGHECSRATAMFTRVNCENAISSMDLVHSRYIVKAGPPSFRYKFTMKVHTGNECLCVMYRPTFDVELTYVDAPKRSMTLVHRPKSDHRQGRKASTTNIHHGHRYFV